MQARRGRTWYWLVLPYVAVALGGCGSPRTDSGSVQDSIDTPTVDSTSAGDEESSSEVTTATSESFSESVSVTSTSVAFSRNCTSGGLPGLSQEFVSNASDPGVLVSVSGDVAAALDLGPAGFDTLDEAVGLTGLGAWVLKDCHEIVSGALELGADPNAPGLDGETVLHLARSKEMVELLIRHGADPSRSTRTTQATPLLSYIDRDAVDLIESSLLAVPDQPVGDAVRWAISSNCQECIQALLDSADIQSTDLESANFKEAFGAQSPSDYANELGFGPIANLLVSRGL